MNHLLNDTLLMAACGLVAMGFASAAAESAKTEDALNVPDLREIDSIPLGIPAAEFVKLRPNADLGGMEDRPESLEERIEEGWPKMTLHESKPPLSEGIGRAADFSPDYYVMYWIREGKLEGFMAVLPDKRLEASQEVYDYFHETYGVPESTEVRTMPGKEASSNELAISWKREDGSVTARFPGASKSRARLSGRDITIALNFVAKGKTAPGDDRLQRSTDAAAIARAFEDAGIVRREAGPLDALLEELLALKAGMPLEDLLEARPNIEYGGMDEPAGTRPVKDPKRPHLSLAEALEDAAALAPWEELLVMYSVRDHRLASVTILLAAEGGFDAAAVRNSVVVLRQLLGPEDSYLTLQTRHEAEKPLSASEHMLLWKRETDDVRLTLPHPEFATAEADRAGGAAIAIQITAQPLSELVGPHGIVHTGEGKTLEVMKALGIPMTPESSLEEKAERGD